MNQIKVTPAYWKKDSRSVSNGWTIWISNNLLTSSCADLRWNEFADITSKLDSLGLTHKDVEGLNCSVIGSSFSAVSWNIF